MLVAITLDDMWDTRTLDVLDEEQVKATLFPCSVNLLKRPQWFLDRSSRHEIGNHTVDHPRLTDLSDAQVVHQIKWANRMIEEVMGVVPRVFAYPYDACDDRILRHVASFGFLAARSCDSTTSLLDRWRLPLHMWIEGGFHVHRPFMICGGHPGLWKSDELRVCIRNLKSIRASFVTLSELARMANMI